MAELDDILEMAKQASADNIPDNSDMAEVSELVTKLQDMRGKIAEIEDALKALKSDELKLSGEIIPSKLDELGMTTFTLSDGSKIGYRTFYSGGVVKGREEEAYEWIIEQGQGHALKGTLDIPFTYEEREKYGMLKEELEAKGFDSTTSFGIHHSTMRSLIGELMQNDIIPPAEIIKSYVGRKTTIKGAK